MRIELAFGILSIVLATTLWVQARSRTPGERRRPEDGQEGTMTPREGRTARRWRSVAVLVLLAGAVLAVAGCGGNDTPAVCDSLETLSSDIDGLQEIDIEPGEGSFAEIEESLDTIRTDLETVKTDAEAELSEPIAGLESSLDAFASDFEAAQTAGELTAESVQTLGDSLAAVSTSWEALKEAAPDCDLE